MLQLRCCQCHKSEGMGLTPLRPYFPCIEISLSMVLRAKIGNHELEDDDYEPEDWDSLEINGAEEAGACQ